MSSPAKSDASPESEENEIAVDLKPHLVHNDPNDDIVIISNDYVQFRASRFHLTRNRKSSCRMNRWRIPTSIVSAADDVPLRSQFFDGLLGSARPKGENFTDNDGPIHLDYPSTTLSLFLDLIGVCDPYTPLISIDQAKNLIKFVDFAICDNLIDKARAALMEASKFHPFELFVIASERHDVEMARFALRKIGSSEFRGQFAKTSGNSFTEEDFLLFKEYLLRLTPDFNAALFHAVMRSGQVYEVARIRPGIFVIEDWRSIADKFDPNQFHKA